MKKEEINVGRKYRLVDMDVEYVGLDKESRGRVLLKPLNDEAIEFYFLKDGLISLSESVFISCYDPIKTEE